MKSGEGLLCGSEALLAHRAQQRQLGPLRPCNKPCTWAHDTQLTSSEPGLRYSRQSTAADRLHSCDMHIFRPYSAQKGNGCHTRSQLGLFRGLGDEHRGELGHVIRPVRHNEGNCLQAALASMPQHAWVLSTIPQNSQPLLMSGPIIYKTRTYDHVSDLLMSNIAVAPD